MPLAFGCAVRSFSIDTNAFKNVWINGLFKTHPLTLKKRIDNVYLLSPVKSQVA